MPDQSVPPTPLFRPEALQHQRRRLWGELVLIQPMATRLLTLLLALVVALCAAWLALASHTRKETVTGYLQPSGGAVDVFARRGGQVAELLVADGQRVRAQDPLLRLSHGRSLPGDSGLLGAALLAELDAQRRQLDQQLADARAGATLEHQELQAAVTARRAVLATLVERLAAQDRLLASARAGYEQTADAARAGNVSRAQLRAADEHRLEQRQRQLAVQQEIDVQRSELERLRLQQQRAPVALRQQLSALEQQLAQLAIRRLETEVGAGETLRAPAAGVVSGLQARVGQTLTAQVPVLTLLPADGAMQAVLLVPSRAYGFVRVGQAVRLRYDAFPHQRFGSWPGAVHSVEQAIRLPSELRAPVSVQEPVYRVVVALQDAAVLAYGQRLPLVAGMSLQADVRLDRRSLLTWMLDPLLSLRGRL